MSIEDQNQPATSEISQTSTTPENCTTANPVTTANQQSNNQAHCEDNTTQGEDAWNGMDESHLKSRVDSETVVNFIENMVQALGNAAYEQYGGQLPNQIKRPAEPQGRKYQNKTVMTIMHKLERVEKYPDMADELIVKDPTVNEWINRNGCKRQDYFEELECAQELTGFFGGHRQFDQAVKAANKAVAMTMLHRREDEETLADLYWVLAELHAGTGNMDAALSHMCKCLALIEPGAGVGHPTYCELLSQLEETRKRCTLVAMA